MEYKLIQGDCVKELEKLPNKSIDCVVTSPPYFNLRDYGVSEQIGMEASVDEYLNKLSSVFSEIYRVLKDTGACWVNIGDVYNNQSSLSCIPDKFKIMMVESGWICRNEIIWHKPNAMPSSAKSRFNNDYEKLYFFVKKSKYYFETQYEPFKSVVAKNTTTKNKGKYQSEEQESLVRQGMNKSRGSKLVYLRKNLPTQEEFVQFMRKRTTIDDIVENSNLKRSKVEHWFRKDKCGFSFPSVDDWNSIKWLIDDWSEKFIDIDAKLTDVTIETDDILKNAQNGRIKRAVWSINTKPFKGCHYAPYPEELIKTPIISSCPKNGIVLDPFCGSGTTGVVCVENERNFIGIELNEEYCEISKKRIEERLLQ